MVASIAFLGALALYWFFPNNEMAELAFLTTFVLSAPFVILHFGRTLFTAAKFEYVVPNEMEGPAYRSDKPVTFWSNVILSAVFIPLIVAGVIVLAGEAIKLAAHGF